MLSSQASGRLSRLKRKEKVPLIHVDVGLLADNVCESPPDTLDRGEGEHDLLFAVDIGVQNTKNVLKILVGDERLQQKEKEIRSNCCVEKSRGLKDPTNAHHGG